MGIQNNRTNSKIPPQISEDIFPTEAFRMFTENKGEHDIIILDVSRPKEFAESHLENAINLNFFSMKFKSRLKALDREKTYFVYCTVGGRSKFAVKMMKKLGFRETYNIVGGSLLWADEELPFAVGTEKPRLFSFRRCLYRIGLLRKKR